MWLGGGGEHYLWDEHQEGERTVREKGERLVLEGGGNYGREHHAGWSIAVEGRVVLGRVDYDGSAEIRGAEELVPAESETDYRGIRLRTDLARRWALTRTHAAELHAGAELDSWLRELRDTKDVDFDAADQVDREELDGNTVAGYTEDYFLLNVRAGAGMRHRIGGAWRLSWRAGVRYPFYVNEYVPANGVTLTPQARLAGFAEVTAAQREGPWAVVLYYDSYRFDESDWVEAGGRGGVFVKQPRSESRSLGLVVRFRIW